MNTSGNKVPLRLIRHHGATLQGLARIAWQSAFPGKPAASIDREPLSQTLAPPSAVLVDAYARWAGAGERYTDTLPPHMVSQWGLAPVSQLLLRTPYPLTRVINQGVTLHIHGELPRQQPLQLVTRFHTLEDRDGLARVSVSVQTGTAAQPNLVDTVLHMAFPLPGQRKEKKARPPEPQRQWQTVGHWRTSKRDGLDFALLTGDFNPIHWIGPAGKASPFGQTVLHGFGMLVRSYEQLGAADLTELDVRFLRPVPLPCDPLQVQNTAADDRGEHRLRLLGNDGTVHLAGRYH